MEERIKSYIKFMDDFLEKYEKNKEEIEKKTDIDNMIKSHLVQISFFQHERLVHLIVTVIFALLEVFSLMLVVIGHNLPSIFLCIAVLILLVPYIRHYYILENDTQKMYVQYDRLLNIKSGGKNPESDFLSYRNIK